MLEALPRAVARAEASPTEKMGPMKRKVKYLGRKDTAVCPFSRAYCTAKNTTEAVLEQAVAMAAPATSR